MQSLSQWAKASGVAFPSPDADARLRGAYGAVFAGNATVEDAELVLVDLAVLTRFYECAAPDAQEGALKYIDGRRSVMRRLVGFIADERILGDLQVTALREAFVTEPKQQRTR